MTLKKHAATLSIVISSLLMTMSCEENNPVINPANTATTSGQTKSTNQYGNRAIDYSFDGTEGGAISLLTTTSWISNYAAQNPQGTKSHFFGATALKKILSSSGCMGIRIYYSIDDSSNKQLLLIGADGNGRNLLPVAGMVGKSSLMDLAGGASTDLLVSTEGTSISEDISKRWISNYSAQNPNGLVAHFFGFEILNQILNQSGCIGIRMYYALNDSGVQQILLVGVNSKGINILPSSQTGREEDGTGTVGDMSWPCPTYCS